MEISRQLTSRDQMQKTQFDLLMYLQTQPKERIKIETELFLITIRLILEEQNLKTNYIKRVY